MFTGIVEEMGRVLDVVDLENARRLTIEGPTATQDAREGDSVAVNGVCLTVTSLEGQTFSCDVMGETLRRTTLGSAAVGTNVNLERALRMGDRLGGHVVQGHVDDIATIVDRTPAQHWESMTFAAPEPLRRYLAYKGSVAVDGVSLTIAALTDTGFTVGLIPTTLAVTTLGTKKIGDTVNIEVDVMAKYAERLLRFGIAGSDSPPPADYVQGFSRQTQGSPSNQG